eukprot:TRINITY_DN35128_c0_g1_i1.p1 TRINITY_DN35128_c0_g1~~TRINITY_DN35128_c0_g1_i1.p1  ORF type:complete len:521 (-),score=66.28 TRINITY_DN35128_c0_g1_i1:169-1731(-)
MMDVVYRLVRDAFFAGVLLLPAVRAVDEVMCSYSNLAIPLAVLAVLCRYPHVIIRKALFGPHTRPSVDGVVCVSPQSRDTDTNNGRSSRSPAYKAAQGCETSLLTLRSNGSAHRVLVRGRRDAPMLVMLHGGPGMSELPFCAKYQRAWEQHFLVVQYDQRASGATYRQNVETMGHRVLSASLTVQAHVQDCIDLIAQLLQRYPQPDGQVFLCGGSWGSALAVLVACARPDLVRGPIVLRGLVTESPASEDRGAAYARHALAALAAGRPGDVPAPDGGTDKTGSGEYGMVAPWAGRNGVVARVRAAVQSVVGWRVRPQYARTAVDALQPPYKTTEALIRAREYLAVAGGMDWSAWASARRGRPVRPWVLKYRAAYAAFSAPEVGLRDAAALKAGLDTSLGAMWSTLQAMRLLDEIGGKVPVPVVVAHGIADRCTAASLVPRFLSELRVEASPASKANRPPEEREGGGGGAGRCVRWQKAVCWFRQSGHSPHKEEPAAFLGLLREVLLGDAGASEYPVEGVV